MEAGGKIFGDAIKASHLIDSFRIVSGTGYLTFILDILIVGLLLYWGYVFLRETRAARILYGLVIIICLFALGNLFNLILLNWILKYLMTMLVVAIPIVFQPELRSALEKLGRAKFIRELNSHTKPLALVESIVSTVITLSQNKIGALIVFQRQTGLREYIEKSTEINAQVSRDMLLTIFFPKSPLHDGAVIISGDQILSARSILPVSEAYLSSDLGTRHKAGLGITENSDAVAIIVSEETGYISMAVNGKLDRRITEERLKNRLIALLRQGK